MGGLPPPAYGSVVNVVGSQPPVMTAAPVTSSVFMPGMASTPVASQRLGVPVVTTTPSMLHAAVTPTATAGLTVPRSGGSTASYGGVLHSILPGTFAAFSNQPSHNQSVINPVISFNTAEDQQNLRSLQQIMSTANKQIKFADFKPANFSNINQDPISFLAQFKDWVNILNSQNYQVTTDEQLIALFGLCMSGTPKVWFSSRRFGSFTELCDLFLQEHSETLRSESAAMKAYQEITFNPKQSVASLARQLQLLDSRLQLGPKVLMLKMLELMPAPVRKQLRLENVKTVDSLVDRAQTLLDIMGYQETEEQRTVYSATGVDPVSHELQNQFVRMLCNVQTLNNELDSARDSISKSTLEHDAAVREARLVREFQSRQSRPTIRRQRITYDEPVHDNYRRRQYAQQSQGSRQPTFDYNTYAGSDPRYRTEQQGTYGGRQGNAYPQRSASDRSQSRGRGRGTSYLNNTSGPAGQSYGRGATSNNERPYQGGYNGNLNRNSQRGGRSFRGRGDRSASRGRSQQPAGANGGNVHFNDQNLG